MVNISIRSYQVDGAAVLFFIAAPLFYQRVSWGSNRHDLLSRDRDELDFPGCTHENTQFGVFYFVDIVTWNLLVGGAFHDLSVGVDGVEVHQVGACCTEAVVIDW